MHLGPTRRTTNLNESTSYHTTSALPSIVGVQPMRYIALRGRHVSERSCRWVQFGSNKRIRNMHAMRSEVLRNFRFAVIRPELEISGHPALLGALAICTNI